MTLLGWLVFQLTGAPFYVALVGFFGMGPMLLLGVFGGILADRFDKRLLLSSTQAANLVAGLLMMALLFTTRIPFWYAYIVAMIGGIGWALDMASRRSIVLDLLGKARTTNAVALDSVGMHSSRMIGPAVGGGLISLVDVSGGYVFICLLYAVSVVLMILVKMPEKDIYIQQSAMSIKLVFRNLAEGAQYVKSNNTILAVIIITIFMNLLLFPYQQLIPVIATKVLGVGPGLMGLLLAAEGLGALTGAIFIASASNMTHHGRVFLYGSLLGLIMLLFFSMSQIYHLSLGIMLILGIGTSGFGTMQGTIIMLVARDDMRGRALGIITLAIGAGPIGAVIIGAVANALGASIAITINAVLGLITVGLVGLLMPAIRGRMVADQGAEERQVYGVEPRAVSTSD